MSKKITKKVIRARSQSDKEDRMNSIIESAIFIIEQDGFNKLTMNAVAKKSKLGKATLYSYFKAREELLFSVLKHDFDLWFESFFEYIENSPSPFCDGFKDFWLGEVKKNSRLTAGFLYLTSNDSPEIQNGLSKDWSLYLLEKLKETHYEIISKFNPTISLEILQDLFVTLTGVTTGLWAQNRMSHSKDIIREDFEYYVSQVIGGVLNLENYKTLKTLERI